MKSNSGTDHIEVSLSSLPESMKLDWAFLTREDFASKIHNSWKLLQRFPSPERYRDPTWGNPNPRLLCWSWLLGPQAVLLAQWTRDWQDLLACRREASIAWISRGSYDKSCSYLRHMQRTNRAAERESQRGSSKICTHKCLNQGDKKLADWSSALWHHRWGNIISCERF